MNTTVADSTISLETDNPRFAKILLALVMFMTGACGLVFEYIMSTVSTYILGNSIEQFSITIALMLFMMGVSGYVQKFLSDENLVEKFIFVEVLIALIGGFAPIGIYAAFGTMEDHFSLVHYFFVCSIGCLIGLEIPLVMRFNQKFSKSLGINIATIYGPDYIGSFLGALIWSFYLLRRFPLTEIGFLLAGANIFVALITLIYFSKHNFVSRKKLSMFAVIVGSGLLIFGYSQNGKWSVDLQQKLYEDPIVFSKTTKYQVLTMTHRKDIDEYRFYINGHLQFSSADEAIYHEQLVHPIMSIIPDHKKVLVLGGGDGMALREILKHDDVESVTLVDLDADMVKFCATDKTLTRLNRNSFANAKVKVRTTGSVTENGTRPVYIENDKVKLKKMHNKFVAKPQVEKVAQVSVINIDADKFVGEIGEKYNVVIIDFPDPNAIELSKLYSKEFFIKVKRLLSENGMIVIQSTSPYHAKEAYLCIRRTMEAAGLTTLPYHDNVPSFGDWGWIMAWKDEVPESAVRERIANMEIKVKTKYLTPEVFRSALVFGKGSLVSKYNDINTLMFPTLLDKYTRESWKID
jgi:spermidine synthase